MTVISAIAILYILIIIDRKSDGIYNHFTNIGCCFKVLYVFQTNDFVEVWENLTAC